MQINSLEEANEIYESIRREFEEISEKYSFRRKFEEEDVEKLLRWRNDLRELMLSDPVQEEVRKVKPDENGVYRGRKETVYGKSLLLWCDVGSLIIEIVKKDKTLISALRAYIQISNA